MNILVVGCGKVGSSLASLLSREGHDVSVVDRQEENFDLLASDFSGYTTNGVPIDQDVLRRAGIENCDAVATMTPDDNINIMVSQLASELFHVPRVIARIYDPKRENVFSHFGLRTVCPTNMTVAAVSASITQDKPTQIMTFGLHTVSYSRITLPKQYIDRPSSEIELEKNEALFAIEHENGRLTLAGSNDILLKKDDTLIFTKIVD